MSSTTPDIDEISYYYGSLLQFFPVDISPEI